MIRDLISRWKSAMPMLILGYVVALASLRLSFSPYLDVDEAQFVGHVDWRFVYDTPHPPLYNWLVRIALEITGWEWAQAVALVKYGLLATFHILVWKTARRLVDDRTALIAVAASAFLPQIVWMASHSLAHTVLVMVGVAATIHAMLRALQEPSIRAFVWLGLAAAIGSLAKYNFFLFFIPFLIVVFADKAMRARLLRPDALVAVAVYLVAVGPALSAAIVDFWATPATATALEAAASAWYDPPFLGLDGAVSLIAAVLAWLGPAVAVWAIARFWDARLGGNAETENLYVDALGRTMALGLASLAVIVLLGDIHGVRERYLTPILAAAPIYLAIARPLSVSAYGVVPIAVALYLSVFAGFWGMVTYGSHRYVYPYDTIASHLRRVGPEPLPIVAERSADRANLVLALGWPGAQTPRLQAIENEVVLVWIGRRDAPERLAPNGFGPADKITTIVAPLLTDRGEPLVYRYQRFARTGVDAAPARQAE